MRRSVKAIASTLAIAALVLAGAIAPMLAHEAYAAGAFKDVNSKTPHREDVLWLASEGISTGFEDGTFRPFDTVKRCDMAAFLYRLAGSPEFTPTAKDKAYFSDVNSKTPHAWEIWWLASMGISKGWDVGGHHEFRPFDTVKRCDMAAFLYRLAGEPSFSPASAQRKYFSDINGGSPHANEVWWLASTKVSAGWTEHNGTHTFRPYENVARCDMAAFLHRMYVKGIVGPPVSTEVFIGDMSTGLNERYSLPDLDTSGMSDPEYLAYLLERLDAEWNHIGVYDGANFMQGDLGNAAQGYLDCMRQMRELLMTYSGDAEEFVYEFNELHASRAKYLSILVDDYGLTVKPKYQAFLNDAMHRTVGVVSIDIVSRQYGYTKVRFVVRNDGTATVHQIDLQIREFDADGYSMGIISGWGSDVIVRPGETATIYIEFNENVKNIEVVGWSCYEGEQGYDVFDLEDFTKPIPFSLD